MQQSVVFWCLFDSSTREAGCIDTALRHLLLGQLVRDSARRKPHSIVGTDPGSETLAMHTALKVKAKLGGVNY